MATPTPKPQRKQRTGYDMSARQHRIRRQEADRAEAAADKQRREEVLGGYLKNLSERYSEAAKQEQADAAAAETPKTGKGGKRPRAVPLMGSGLQLKSGVQVDGLSYRSNEEALPSRYQGRRNKSPRNKGKNGKSAAARTQPEYDATALDFGPSLGTAAPKLPVIWGAGMPKPQPPPKAEPTAEPAEARESEVAPKATSGYAAAAASPPKPNTPPPAPAPTPVAPENDVWGADSDDDEDGADVTPLQPGQAWGDMA